MMPGMDGYETCRRIREDPATSFVPVVMVTASGDAEKVRGHRGRGRRLRHQAAQPGRAAGPGALARAGQALPRHRGRAGGGARRVEPAARGARRRPGRPSSTGSAGCAASCRRRSPSSWSTPGTSRSCAATAARSSRCSPTCAASRRSPRAASRRRPWRCWPSTTWRSVSSCSPTRGPSSTSPATGCSSSSTTPSPARTHRTARCGWRWTCARGSPSWRRGGAGRGTTSASGSGIAQGYATLGPGRLPRPLRLRRHRHGHQPRRPAVRRGEGRPDPRLPAGQARDLGPVGLPRGGPPGAQGLQPAGGGATRSSHCTRKGCRHERRRRGRTERSPSSTRTAATRSSTHSRRGCRRCGRRCAATTRASRWSSCRR